MSARGSEVVSAESLPACCCCPDTESGDSEYLSDYGPMALYMMYKYVPTTKQSPPSTAKTTIFRALPPAFAGDGAAFVGHWTDRRVATFDPQWRQKAECDGISSPQVRQYIYIGLSGAYAWFRDTTPDVETGRVIVRPESMSGRAGYYNQSSEEEKENPEGQQQQAGKQRQQGCSRPRSACM